MTRHAQRGLIVAIDGPAGAGKSTVSRLLAQRVGYRYINTGALYRAIGLLALERGIDPNDGERLAAVCEAADVSLSDDRILLDDRDITEDIDRPEVSQWASKVSAQPRVRAALLGLQRRLGAAGAAVLEGRDIGTVVFPHADLKIFLDASVEERGRRRHTELSAKGHVGASLEQTIRDVEERDRRDSGRAHAPLRPADDAIRLDTTHLSRAEVVERLAALVHARACLPRGDTDVATGGEKPGR